MRRYDGNTGRYIHIPDPQPNRSEPALKTEREPVPDPTKTQKMPPPKNFGSGLQSILSNVFAQGFETEDLLLFAVLFLMYRETGDKELLIIMGGMFLL